MSTVNEGGVMPDHGTRARYHRGCRCEPCRGANAAYDRELRARAGLPTHGKRSTYTAGCRCEPCRSANTAYHLEKYGAPTSARGRTAERIEDLEWLLRMGEWPPRAAERVGWSAETAQRMLYRHRPELASVMGGVA